MTSEQIRKRIAELEQQRQSVFTDFQALHGAIQDCFFWLAIVEKEENSKNIEGKDGERTTLGSHGR